MEKIKRLNVLEAKSPAEYDYYDFTTYHAIYLNSMIDKYEGIYETAKTDYLRNKCEQLLNVYKRYIELLDESVKLTNKKGENKTYDYLKRVLEVKLYQKQKEETGPVWTPEYETLNDKINLLRECLNVKFRGKKKLVEEIGILNNLNEALQLEIKRIEINELYRSEYIIRPETNEGETNEESKNVENKISDRCDSISKKIAEDIKEEMKRSPERIEEEEKVLLKELGVVKRFEKYVRDNRVESLYENFEVCKPNDEVEKVQVALEFQRGINSGEYNDGKYYYLFKDGEGSLMIARNTKLFEVKNQDYTLVRLHYQV